ncbi:hypothetical protein KDM41_10105, partial [bacterium]|nr:hypothetical protein [bacterium]
ATAAYAACLAAHGPGATHHHVRAQLGLCRLAVAAGDAEAARRRAEAALALAPADAEALLVLVSLTAARGDSAEAAAWARAHVAHHPTATEAVAGALLECGLAEAAAAVLGDGPTGAPALGLGLLTCALALGRDLELDLDLDPEAADAAFRAWISRLWRSRRTDLMAAFAANAGAVTGAFPWLEEFLAAETARLRGG